MDLASPRVRWALGSALGLAFLLCAGLGSALTYAFGGTDAHALRQIRSLQGQVQEQTAQLAAVRGDARRDMDALAMRLGRLQAQSVRLDALGERLTEVGKLDSAEFDFEHQPAVGGIEVSDGPAYTLPATLDQRISDLASQFDSQQAQLTALQSLLLDAKIESNLKPTGMPVQGYISSYFGSRSDPFDGHSARHTGIDIATPKGTPVHAVAEGMVTFAGVRRGYGNVVEIDHGNGYMTRYAHNSKLVVKPGQHVQVGTVIAKAGSTGRSTGSHVHFEVWYHGRVINPLSFARSHR